MGMEYLSSSSKFSTVQEALRREKYVLVLGFWSRNAWQSLTLALLLCNSPGTVEESYRSYFL